MHVLRTRSIVFSFMIIAILLAVSQADDRLAADARVDKVLVLKKERTLILLDHGKVLKKYRVALGGHPLGPKTRQGDHKTPEGNYVLDRRNEHSRFYRSLHVSYPSVNDRAQAQKSGVEPGGDVGRLLPAELARLAVPELELDTLRRVAERQALCREYRATEPAGKGPIVVGPGSRSGIPTWWAARKLHRRSRHEYLPTNSC